MQLLLLTGHRYIELFLRSHPDSGNSQGWGGSGGGSNFGGGNSGGKYGMLLVSFISIPSKISSLTTAQSGK